MKKEYRSFENARKFARKLKLKNFDEWNSYCKSGNKPKDIPSSPRYNYKNMGWISSGDFLGTGRIADQKKIFRDFKQAREFVHALKLKTQKEWQKFTISGNKPEDIPSAPNKIYKEWISLGDWLGTGNIASKNKNFFPFVKSREIVRGLNLKGEAGWHEYRKSGNKPNGIPSNPNTIYKKEWKNWGDWFGTGTLSVQSVSQNYLSFKEAKKQSRELAKKYNLKTFDDWKKAHREGKVPDNIPMRPERVYSKKRKK